MAEKIDDAVSPLAWVAEPDGINTSFSSCGILAFNLMSHREIAKALLLNGVAPFTIIRSRTTEACYTAKVVFPVLLMGDSVEAASIRSDSVSINFKLPGTQPKSLPSQPSNGFKFIDIHRSSSTGDDRRTVFAA